jgi:hypothetical protein
MFYRHLKNELWKLFGKKRTYIGFGAFLLSQNAMLLLSASPAGRKTGNACSQAMVTWRRNLSPR